jgi:hypothetical protein
MIEQFTVEPKVRTLKAEYTFIKKNDLMAIHGFIQPPYKKFPKRTRRQRKKAYAKYKKEWIQALENELVGKLTAAIQDEMDREILTTLNLK